MTKHTMAFMVTSPPHSNNTATALCFIEAALLNPSVEVLGVFFYQNGVLNASNVLAMPNDEFQALKGWQKLHEKYQVPLHLCITAGEKRGLSDEITFAQGTHNNISSHFIVSGLGELVELTAKADRMVQL
jgi:tRNA 2-thiouridine synthesizing protein D